MPVPKEKAQPKTPSVMANTTVNPPQATITATTPRTPTREEIELAAYALYLERGAFEGYAVDDWLQAERELIDGAEAQRRARAKGA